MGKEKPQFVAVELYFEDLEKAERFYRDLLGFKPSEMSAGHHVKFEAGGTFLCLERKGVEPYPSRDKAALFFEVPNLRTAVERVGGARVVHFEQRGGGNRPAWAVLPDPEGHNVLLLQARRTQRRKKP